VSDRGPAVVCLAAGVKAAEQQAAQKRRQAKRPTKFLKVKMQFTISQPANMAVRIDDALKIYERNEKKDIDSCITICYK
jgi:hypothetical protein